MLQAFNHNWKRRVWLQRSLLVIRFLGTCLIEAIMWWLCLILCSETGQEQKTLRSKLGLYAVTPGLLQLLHADAQCCWRCPWVFCVASSCCSEGVRLPGVLCHICQPCADALGARGPLRQHHAPDPRRDPSWSFVSLGSPADSSTSFSSAIKGG